MKTSCFTTRFCSLFFYRQLGEIVAYARKRGVQLMNDMPFYVDYDSADVWMARSQFLLHPDAGLPLWAAARRTTMYRPGSAGTCRCMI